jgi:hypothetical protein
MRPFALVSIIFFGRVALVFKNLREAPAGEVAAAAEGLAKRAAQRVFGIKRARKEALKLARCRFK